MNCTYDLDSRLTQVSDPTGTYSFTFDNMGRLIGTATSYTFLPGRNFTTSYTYDKASNRTGFTDPEGGSTTYVYDTLHRLQTLTPPTAFGSGSFGFSYDALSRRTQMTRPNNVTTNYAYDNLSRLTSVLHQLAGSTIDGAMYTVDNAGNRTAKTDQRTAVATSYGYDNIYQLLSAMQGATTTENYTYDPVGNRLSDLSTSGWSNNTSNELTSRPGLSYTFDANGNTTGKTDSTGTTSYTWDLENRLTSATLPGAGGIVSFKYDPFGRRIYKSSSSGTSIFAYDNDNLIEETNSAGAVVARYTQTQNTDEALAMLRSGATSFYEIDGLSTVTSLSNAAGALAQTYTFDSFGNQTASSGSLTNAFRFTGREFDSETNLQFSRARYYDPSSGRFLSEDPIKFDGGVNFYRYVGNDPTDSTDPYGLLQLCCRVARSVYWLGIKGCHCFLKLSDGTTLGGYFKLSTYLLLEKRPNENDDRNPKDTPDCKDLPGSDCDARRAFGDLPRFQPYGLGGTSNSIPAAVLTLAGVPFRMPSCAFGAFPFNLGALGSKAPVPIGSVPKPNFP